MEINDQNKVFHEIQNKWKKEYPSSCEEVVNELVNQRNKDRKIRIEWTIKNAGKIYAYKTLCNHYKK